jgi:hypothetical protein
MAEGEEISDDEREQRHGHVPHESFLSKGIRKLFAPFGLLQPDDGDVYVPPQASRVRDPLEDTPEEELNEFETERGMRNPEHPGESMSGTL